jgi:hypothetical protein
LKLLDILSPREILRGRCVARGAHMGHNEHRERPI